ncbi:MAG: 2-methylisocitrate lyase-like PEP mutase family enzyme [Halocynthiibacter sp.]|jgi:2-methylisocitrate lyase-like PEP mutase family enzyme
MEDIGSQFRALHRPGQPFILANAWDAGSAKMLQSMGAKAIATSSAAHAFTLGFADDGTLTRDQALAHAQDLVAAVSVPVSGDFENGFGEDPETCAETVRLAGEIGLAGICIEDTALPGTSAYARELAVERVRAAAEAARALPRDFFLVARADGCLVGGYGIEEAIARIQAFDAAGADGLYVPIPPSMEDLARICQATKKPVNALAAGPFAKTSLDAFAAIGIARVSMGGALARASHKLIYDLCTEMFEKGNFSGLGDILPSKIMDKLLAEAS